jgi:hypothetical protein
MSNPWFRFYSAAIRHPKVAKLPDNDFRLWLNLLAVACENNGLIPPLEDLKHVLNARLDHLLRGIERLISALLIDRLEVGYTPHNWTKKQFISDTSTPRVTLHRKKHAVTVTPPEQNRTDSDTDTDKKEDGICSAREVSHEIIFDPTNNLEKIIREAAGWESHPSPNLFVVGQIRELIRNGASLESDVIPIIRRDAPRCRSPNWNYFTNAIAQARADREAASKLNPEARPNARTNSKLNSIADSSAIVEAAIAKRTRELDALIASSEEVGSDVGSIPRLRESPT